MIMRLHALDVIDDDTKANLFKRRSARWCGKSEPNDKDRNPEQPRLVKRSLELMINSGVMPLEGVVKYFGLSEKDVEQLAGLEPGFLSGKLQSTRKIWCEIDLDIKIAHLNGL